MVLFLYRYHTHVLNLLLCVMFQGSPTNNVSPTSTPAKSAAAVPTLEPPRAEAAPAAAETATE